ncbi:glycosyltransferase [Ruegeria arenilitoris]|uniref:glycosyltransferase n=1 Tax=Ruegeria arenilitoris TaxID=1173585 RepID=UPI00147CA0EE|nr:glycosyltransferase [Ruegeria arenilitoris]
MSTPPKLLYFLNSFNRGGAEIGVKTLLELGLFDGFEITIVAISRGNGRLDDGLTALGYKVIYFSASDRMTMKDLAVSFFRLSKLISQMNPDIVIGSLPQANIVARLACWTKPKITFISYEHNTHLAKRLYELAFKLTSSRVDWVFADANFTLKTTLRRLYFREPKQTSIVPLVFFDTPAKCYQHPNSTKPFRVINTGRFTNTKNQSAIIEAISILRNRGKEVSLTLFGEGENLHKCRTLVKKLDLTNTVKFSGFVENWPEQPSDCFVLASRHEGLCIVALEAMHAGIPVISPLVGGINDYGNEKNILPLSSVEPTEIANSIQELLDQPNEAASRAKSAAKIVNDHYSIASVKKRITEVNRTMHLSVETMNPLPEPE